MAEMVATRDAYGKALVELGKVNENIIVLDADLSKSTKTYAFGQEFPERFINVGIAEQNLMGVAAGLSTAGKIVFASTFAIFATGRAFEIVRNAIGYPKLNVKICATHSGITVGEDGASHQAIEDISCMRTIPNMTVIVPSDSVETRAAIHAVSKMDGPVYVRLGRLAVPTINDKTSYKFEIGKGVVLNKGDDATIIATGLMVGEALKAAKELETKGIKARVINIHTIKPIDENLIIEAAKETGAIVTAEEHNIIGGLGSAVAEVIGENCPVPLKRIGIRDTFGDSGKPAELMKKYGLTSDGIVKAVISLIDRK